MKVVLDTNVFCADYRFTGGAAKIFWSALPRLGVRCVVPEVVRDEVLLVYERHIQDASRELAAATQKWSRLTGTSKLISTTPVEQSVEAYAMFLDAHFQTHSVHVEKYPAISHQDLVMRAARRKKPFNASGSGYRDALIWATLRHLRNSDGDDLCFVTSNSKDFGKAPALHPDLQGELGDAAVVLFNTLEQFNAAEVVPNLERLESTLQALQAGSFPGFSLVDWIKTDMADVLNDGEHGADFVGLEPGHGHVWVSEVKAQENLQLDDVRLLPSGDMVVLANVDLVLDVSVSADWDDCDRYRDIREFFGGDCSGHPMAMVEERGTVAFTLTVERDSFEVDWCEVDEVHGDMYSVTINPHPRRDD